MFSKFNDAVEAFSHFGKLVDAFNQLCINNPVAAGLIFLIISFFGLNLITNQIYIFVRQLKNSGSKKVRLYFILVGIISITLSILVVCGVRVASAIKPIFINAQNQVLVGERLNIRWKYNLEEDMQDVALKLKYLLQDWENSSQNKKKTQRILDSNIYHVDANMNSERYWRVRAGTGTNNNLDTFKPISPWSKTLRTTDYKNIYTRISKTKKLIIYTSNSYNQGIFKFSFENEASGFEYELIKLIRNKIFEKLDLAGGNIEVMPVKWEKLLSKPREGEADMIVSSITIRKDREKEYELLFSEPYYETKLAIACRQDRVPKVQIQKNKVLEILSGEHVGFQKGTTTVEVLDELNKIISKNTREKIQTTPYSEARESIDALIDSDVSCVVADSPFIEASKNRLKEDFDAAKINIIELDDSYFPTGFNSELVSEKYGIAVHRRENKLLKVIDEKIQELERNGELRKIEEQSEAKFKKLIDSSEIPS